MVKGYLIIVNDSKIHDDQLHLEIQAILDVD